MVFTNRVSWEPLRSIDSATFTGSYQAVGTPLKNPSFLLKVVNNSNQLVTVSFDGTSDYDICPSGSFFLYDETKTERYEMLPANTQIYVKGSVGTGLVYVVTQFIIHP
jgi:hypothetical protein